MISFRESQDKQWIKRLLKRIHSPQVLSLLCAFLVTYYNSINEDASLEIQCELPMVPLTVNEQKVFLSLGGLHSFAVFQEQWRATCFPNFQPITLEHCTMAEMTPI